MNYQEIKNLLNEGKRQLIIKDIDNELLIGFLTGSIEGHVKQIKRLRIQPTPQIIDTAFELILGSVKI